MWGNVESVELSQLNMQKYKNCPLQNSLNFTKEYKEQEKIK